MLKPITKMIRSTLKRLLRHNYAGRKLPPSLRRRMALPEIESLNLDRTTAYLYCVYFFDNFLPESLKNHRRYFLQNQRGFGEDAFHAMWFLIFEHLKPANALEIGVYRGQTITLWKLLANYFGFECRVSCISPFSPAGDSVSNYSQLDYFEDVKKNHKVFDLEFPEVFKGFSTEQGARVLAGSKKWNVCYIDGNHDYNVAKSDWEMCVEALSENGIIILDDSSLNTDFAPPFFATAGHPGPSKLAGEITAQGYEEYLNAGHNRVFRKKNRN